MCDDADDVQEESLSSLAEALRDRAEARAPCEGEELRTYMAYIYTLKDQ